MTKLRRSKPAAVSRIIARAISAVARSPRARRRPPPSPDLAPSFRLACRSERAAKRAGARPKTKLAPMERNSAKANTPSSTRMGCVWGKPAARARAGYKRPSRRFRHPPPRPRDPAPRFPSATGARCELDSRPARSTRQLPLRVPWRAPAADGQRWRRRSRGPSRRLPTRPAAIVARCSQPPAAAEPREWSTPSPRWESPEPDGRQSRPSPLGPAPQKRRV